LVSFGSINNGNPFIFFSTNQKIARIKLFIQIFLKAKKSIMHAHIKGVLVEGFAKHLKIRDVEDATALTTVAQKYLALGVNVVPTQRVYDAICTDYTLLAMRTHYPPLSAYSEPKSAPFDPLTFTEIIKQGFDSKKQTKLIENSIEFNRFVDLITARTQDQERWVDACRQDKWKDVALYLGLNYKENPCFYRLLKTIAEQDDVSTLNKRLLTYQPKDVNALGREMTAFIQSINLPAAFCDEILFASVDHPQKERLEEKSIEEEVSKEKVLKLNHNKDISHKVDDLRENLESYRKRAGLPAVVDSKRVAQQMVYSSLGESIPSNLLTRTQKALTPIENEQEKNLVLDIIESDAFDATSLEEALSLSEKAAKMVRVTGKYEWDARELLQYCVAPEQYLDERTLARFNKLKI
jgi:hypothetical protein